MLARNRANDRPVGGGFARDRHGEAIARFATPS